MIQDYRDPAGGQRRSTREFIPYSLTLEAFKATYAEPILPVEVEGLEPQGDNNCRAPLFKKSRGGPQTARLKSGEQRAGRLHGMGLYNISLTGYAELCVLTGNEKRIHAVEDCAGSPGVKRP